MNLTVNDKVYPVSVEQQNMTLLLFLREVLGLTGTKNGCGIGVCGTCTVLVDGKPKRSCRLKVGDVAAQNVTTIEGVSPDPTHLHPVQQAFIDAGAIQCGFCTPGMVLTTIALLNDNPNPTREEVKKALNTNLCRCTGYQQIFDAVLLAASQLNK